MSLHAQLHPDAQRRFEAQQRNARTTSIIIAILGTTLLALLLGFFAMKIVAETYPGTQYVSVPSLPPEIIDTPILDPSFKKKPTPPSGARNRVLVAPIVSDVAVPVPDEVPPTDNTAFGTGDSDNIGDDEPFGGPGGSNPPIKFPHPQRCSKPDRLARLSANGAGPEVDDAVVNTLRWLKSTQHQTGSWGQQHKVGMTGFALLAYLGHCETPVSEEFGASCTDALVYLIDLGLRHNGKLATDLNAKHWPYEHAIATYALAEALSFARLHGYNIPNHSEVVQNAGQWIINNQHESGGWDYAYDESGPRGGDLSIVGWQLQALKACKATGLDFKNLERCTRDALAYVEARQATSGGFGYTGTTPAGNLDVHSLTGVGVLSFQIWDKASHSAARKGIRYIADRSPFDYNTADCDLYAHYYSSQAMMRYGGETWNTYNQGFAKQLLDAQNPDGSFKQPGSGAAPKAVAASFAQNNAEGLHYRNCLAALMLEVYYRYLPATGK